MPSRISRAISEKSFPFLSKSSKTLPFHFSSTFSLFLFSFWLLYLLGFLSFLLLFLSVSIPSLDMGRFDCLIDSEEGLASFRTQYRIPPNVDIRYCKEGEWFEKRQEGEVVIPMIAFIERGMKIPMGTVTRDYLRAHRLALTQCAPNMFRILGSVDALNEKMGLGLTHHDVNWVYNLHHLKG